MPWKQKFLIPGSTLSVVADFDIWLLRSHRGLRAFDPVSGRIVWENNIPELEGIVNKEIIRAGDYVISTYVKNYLKNEAWVFANIPETGKKAWYLEVRGDVLAKGLTYSEYLIYTGRYLMLRDKKAKKNLLIDPATGEIAFEMPFLRWKYHCHAGNYLYLNEFGTRKLFRIPWAFGPEDRFEAVMPRFSFSHFCAKDEFLCLRKVEETGEEEKNYSLLWLEANKLKPLGEMPISGSPQNPEMLFLKYPHELLFYYQGYGVEKIDLLEGESKWHLPFPARKMVYTPHGLIGGKSGHNLRLFEEEEGDSEELPLRTDPWMQYAGGQLFVNADAVNSETGKLEAMTMVLEFE